MPKTPAPTKPKAPDVISQARLGGDGYNQNSGSSNPSSLDPGQSKISAMGANLKASSDDGENVLDTIIKQGAKLDHGWQTRALADKNVPTHPGMKSPNSAGTVPAKLGASSAQPVRKP